MRKEWTRKAAEADRVWNNIPKGVGGPIQRRFRSRPGIKGLAFGFYGDWSREVDGGEGSTIARLPRIRRQKGIAARFIAAATMASFNITFHLRGALPR